MVYDITREQAVNAAKKYVQSTKYAGEGEYRAFIACYTLLHTSPEERNIVQRV